MPKIGEFELFVALAILRQGEAAYANRVRDDLEANSGRSVTRGALYRTLERLREKGFVEWEIEPSGTPERGGHPSRRLYLTDPGMEAVKRSRETLLDFMEPLSPLFERGAS